MRVWVETCERVHCQCIQSTVGVEALALSWSLLVRDLILWYCLLDGSRENSLWQGWLESLAIFWGLLQILLGVYVLNGWELAHSDVLGCPHHPL
jgi:hypothetical protein